MLRYNEHVTSLDAPLDRDGGVSVAEGVADDSALAPELLLHNAEIEAWVRLWLSELNERQRTVIERRYGLNGHDVATLEELAGELDVTRERVRQIQAEALEKLRSRSKRRGLDRDALSEAVTAGYGRRRERRAAARAARRSRARAVRARPRVRAASPAVVGAAGP